MIEIKNRMDFLLLIDVQNGNPNGDPDAGNLPRIDAETGHGLVTDVCLKRKVRNYVQEVMGGTKGYDIFIKEKAVLNSLIANAYKAKEVAEMADDNDKLEAARDYLCRYHWDIRTFGAVMTTGNNGGQVRGPIQLDCARSIDPVNPCELTITRMAVTTEEESEKQRGGNRTMGRKTIIPYGLYLCHGFISPSLAQQSGFSEADLELFWKALINMFDIDRSAARGLMSTQKLIVFRHDSKLGNAPANKLFDLVSVERKDKTKPARSFKDYNVTIDRNAIPTGVEVIEML